MADTQTVPDWRHEARTLILAGMGHRETARKLGLPEDRVIQWAYRAGLAKDRERAVSTLVSSSVIKGASAGQILADTAREDAHATRLAFIRRARVVVESAAVRAEADPEKALAEAPLLASEATTLQRANAPGFERQQEQQAQQVVNIALLGAELPQISVTADVPVLPSTGDSCPDSDSA